MSAFFWAILATLTWGCVPILEKMGLMKVPIFPAIFFRCLGVLGGFTVLTLWKFQEIKEFTVSSAGGWWYLVLGGLMASIVGQIFFYHALQNGEASRIVPIAGAFPLVSFILGIFFLGEGVTMFKFLGVFFVVIGVFLLQ